MDSSKQSNAVVAFATFVRQRLADAAESLAPLWARREDSESAPAPLHEASAMASARHLAMVIIGAAAPFAPTSQARARLLRQAHASGLLTARETERAIETLGAPR